MSLFGVRSGHICSNISAPEYQEMQLKERVCVSLWFDFILPKHMSDSNEFERVYSTIQYNTVFMPSAGPSAPCIYPTEDLPISSQGLHTKSLCASGSPNPIFRNVAL